MNGHLKAGRDRRTSIGSEERLVSKDKELGYMMWGQKSPDVVF